MRQIKFRGKRVDNGEWVEGLLVYLNEIRVFYDHSFVDENGNKVEYQTTEDIRISPSTVGQFTGLLDKNGKEIWEGDILFCHEYDSSDCGHRILQTFKNAVVGFSNGSYHYHPNGNIKQPHQLLMYAYKPEIIGNIHDNPKLIN